MRRLTQTESENGWGWTPPAPPKVPREPVDPTWFPAPRGFEFILAENECDHGRLPVDDTPPCGCWPEEGGRKQ